VFKPVVITELLVANFFSNSNPWAQLVNTDLGSHLKWKNVRESFHGKHQFNVSFHPKGSFLFHTFLWTCKSEEGERNIWQRQKRICSQSDWARLIYSSHMLCTHTHSLDRSVSSIYSPWITNRFNLNKNVTFSSCNTHSVALNSNRMVQHHI